MLVECLLAGCWVQGTCFLDQYPGVRVVPARVGQCHDCHVTIMSLAAYSSQSANQLNIYNAVYSPEK